MTTTQTGHRRHWRDGLVLGLAVGGVFMAWSASEAAAANKSAKAAPPVPGAELFAQEKVRQIKIELAPKAMEALRRDNRKYAPATVTEGGTVYREVGVHLKGAAGSFRGVDDKPALTLDFNHFVPGQKFYGLRKIHLNNSVQDGSYLTENLCGELFRSAGVPTPRAGYALVALNGRPFGLYVLKEGFTKDFLSLYFTNRNGNLYDGGFLREITEPLERDAGEDVKDGSDLKALAAAAQEPNPELRWERLRPVLDLDRFISFMVMENMTWDWDGYVMNRNNYRVYHDLDTGRMVFFPHGMDQMFWNTDGPWNGNLNGLLAQAVIRTPEGRRRYRQRYSQLLTNVFTREFLTNRIAQLGALVQSGLATLDRNAPRHYAGQLQRMRDLVNGRLNYLNKQFSQAEPKALKFQQDQAKVAGWREQNEDQSGRLDQSKDAEDRPLLHIQAQRRTAASWRARVWLEGGRYRFEGRARTVGVEAVQDEKGAGAGLRISGSEQPRANRLAGDAAWQTLAYEFEVPPPSDEVELVCELRATKGEVWFDPASLRLVRMK